MTHIAYIHTGSGLSVFLDGKVLSIARTDSRFEPALAALNDPNGVDEGVLRAVLAPPAAKIQATIDRQELTDRIAIVDGELQYNGVGVHNTLASRILEHEKLQYDLRPLLAFLDNVMQNPSYRAVNDLYAFLEAGGIPITTDGHFLAYKAVRDNWFDIHSGTFDNSIGRVVEIPRNQVDENPDRTCSRGLHVCSFAYLPSFAHADGHVVIVKVNPRDVVAIPTDYNNTKMRVCRYEVVGEVENYYADQSDILRDRAVTDEWDAIPEEPEPEPEPEPELRYSVVAFDSLGNAFDQGFYDESYEDFNEACDAALHVLDLGAAKVVILDEGLVIFTFTQP